jgi:hypothetical protein
MPRPSKYGREFDEYAERWANLEGEHDLIHPNRSDCGGVGGCSMMRAAHDLKTNMIDALEARRLSL